MFHWQLGFTCFLFGLMILWVQSADEEEGCPVYEFACKNGSECIPSEWRCDRDFDCKDASDEQDCEGKFCDPELAFKCLTTSRCIPHGWFCDGIDDCGDNSDEQGDECETKPESCSVDEYQCPGMNECIPLDLLCDQSIDCGDGSDEGSHCLSQIEKCAEKHCQEMCKYSISGARCYCGEGRQLDANNRTCSDYNECEMVRVPVCDQVCVNHESASNTCDCVEGFSLQGDNGTCKSNTTTNALLLVASGEKIMTLSLLGKIVSDDLQAVRANAINYDYKRQKVCWIDRTRNGRLLKCVDSKTMNNSKTIQMAFDMRGVEQFAIEWTTGNFYFVDSRSERIFICTGHDEDNQCLTIVSDGLTNPRGIAIDPAARYFFVSDWSTNPKIIRYSMDGSNAVVIVKTKISLPQCLTLDIFTRRVYWTDANMDHIQSIPYDGNQGLRYTIISGPDMMDHPYGVAVFENYMYSTNWREQFEIRKTNRFQSFSNTSEILYKGSMQSAAIQVYHSSLQPPVSHSCAFDNGGCDHFCLIVDGQKKQYCRCTIGFNLNDNGTCSRRVLKEGFLVYGKGMPGAIKGISMDPDDKYDVIEPLLNMESPRGIDFDIKEEYIYYADSVAFRIVRRPIVGKTSDTQQLLNQYVNNCEGIAVDWISRNLYWTDDGLRRISMAKLNGTHRRTLITTNLTHPRAIVVDPVDGYMYWTDWSEYDVQLAKIERSYLDGTERQVMVSGETILWPNGLALDKSGNYLYWCDAFFDEINRIHLNGTGREIIYNGEKLEMPFGLSFLNNVLFWTERKSGKIYRYEIGNEPLILRDEGQEVFEIRAYSSQLQTGDNGCSVENGRCQQLCANTPSGISCLCEDGYQLQANNGSCEVDPENPQGTHCDATEEITCNNGRCVRTAWKCDGDDDCGDGTDESEEICSNKACPDSQFMCSNYKCIPKKYLCDGDLDCHDGSDETENICSLITCAPQEFTCDNGKCILPVWKCDRDDDCGDNSDEIDCVYESCTTNEFACTNGRCININWRCDTDNDCGDNSDEVLCRYRCDNSTQFTCDSQQCISLEFVCNGVDDCDDGSDEASDGCTPPPFLCTDSQFHCGSGICILKAFVCDADEDCIDGSDELNCGTGVFSCDIKEFQCSNGQCIPWEWRCDGDPDCEDGTDEAENLCPPKLCDSGDWSCPNHTLCIPLNNLCDGAEQCPGGYDEGFDCDVDACTHPNIDCSHGCQNAPIGHYCTCPDGFRLDDDDVSTCIPDMNMCRKKRCSQQCTNLKGNYSCSCYDGYRLMDDRWTCKSTDNVAPLLVFSNRHQLRFLNMRNEEYGILVNGMRNTIALDFYQAENSVFWTDVVDDKIYRGYLTDETLSDGSGLVNRTVVVSSGLATAEGLAVDWIGQNLYWVDSHLDQIEVAKLNGSHRTTVIAGNMESPRAITLDSRKGIMFWTDWDNTLPRIESATMSGMNRSVIITVAELSGGWPNGLTLDYEENRILWIDARSDSIHSAFYNGSNIITILKGHEYLYHPFAITLFEGYLYWTDWRTNKVYKARKWDGHDLQPVQKTQTQPFDIHVIHPYRQPQGQNPCDNNGGCSHLCLLNGVESACLCPHMMKLGSNMKTCQNDIAFLVILKPTVIRGVDLGDGDFSVIPSWTLPRILNVSSITFSSRENRFYWVDINRKTISRAFINGTGLETVLAGITNGTSIALDWITGNIMWTSDSLSDGQINVAKLDGSYRNVVLNGLEKPRNLILQPSIGQMYWINSGSKPSIEQSTMNGTNRVIIQIDNLVQLTSIALSTDGNKLYWADSGRIGVYILRNGSQSIFYTLNDNTSPIALVAHTDYLYWADNASSISSITYTEGIVKIIKQDYPDVNELLVYDPEAQTSSSNACSNSSCQQMCLPLSENTTTCLCTAGYVLDTNQQTCKGITSFLLYSVDSSIQGLSLSSDSSEQALTPITGTALSVSIDFDYKGDYIYWVDTAVSRIRRIKRDLSGREDIVSDGLGRVEGIAYDWIAENLYWTDQQLDLIEVASANGSYRYVLISDDLEKPRSIVVYPQKGLLFWSDWGRYPKIERSTLAGTARMVLVNSSISWPNGITIDYEQDYVYWCEAQLNKIERIKIDGTERYAFGEAGHQDPFSITILGDMMYWTDRTYDGGSIRKANKTNGNDTTTLQSNIGVQIKDIHAFHESKQTGTNKCSAQTNPCEQLCFYLGDQRLQCACAYGVLKDDGKTCRNYNAFIIYSERNILRSLSMVNNSNVYQNAWEPIKNDNIKNAVSLAVDFSHQRIFYSDIQLGNIEEVKFNGTGQKSVVNGAGSAEGLTYDPAFQELYWTSYSNSSINRLKPKSEPEIIVQLSSQDRPRGIVVDSCTGHLYWTNWNENSPSIMKSRTNGFHTHTIITEDIRTPNSITLDHTAQKIYWADARLDKLERCDVDGTNRHIILTSDPVHPFGLVVHENYLYWTDWVRRAVIRVDKYTGGNLVLVRKQLPQHPMGIAVAFNDTEKCILWPCNINNGGCDGSCTTDEFGLVQCTCPPDKIISDTFRCINKTISCANESFSCHDGACIQYEASCNGINNCPDGSDEDENYCSMRTCRKGYFTCLSGGCVLSTMRCNGINNCHDGSDEVDCLLSCDANEFRCTDGDCIDSSNRCNYRVECKDFSDEVGCPNKDCVLFALTQEVPLPDGMVLKECANTTLCYLPSWKCDGENDCGDNSDETGCDPTPKTDCGSQFFTCSQTGRCIPLSWKCDQDNDCGDNEDEQESCEYTCVEGQFQCDSGRCIPNGWKCDGDNDCGDHSDEGELCDTKTCDPDKFLCAGSNICIPLSWVCDGDVDCENATDEFPVRACAATVCYEGEFACDNKRCIQESWTCDHEDDCGDNSDEHDLCEYTKCTDEEFNCTNLRCVAKSWRCDGADDCQDNSDEEGCDDVSPTDQFCCRSGKCISSSALCDGRLDCEDGLDELNCNTTECSDGAASPCQQVCKDTLQGYECACYRGYQLKNDHYSCEDVNECNTTYPCSQQCFNTIGSFRCGCSPSYVLQQDHRRCKADSVVVPMIYFSNRYFIRKIDPHGHNYTHVSQQLPFANVVALDFDWYEMKLYWSDVTQQGSKISRMDMDGSNIEDLHKLGVRNPDGLAVDWIGRNLYWCDKGLDVIEVSKLNGQYRKTLINKDLDEPRAIVVNPMKGEMFWTDWGVDPYIARADMDGNNMQKIVTEKLGWPNGLTIDYTTNYIFWADAREDRIEFATSTGQNRRTIISRNTPHAFALTLFEDWIYWSDWENRTISKANKYTGLNRTVLVTSLHRPMDLHVVHPLRQVSGYNPCEDGGPCSNLCLLTPGEHFTCACPNNFYLAGDESSCVSNCSASQFTCGNDKCVPYWWRCDNEDDCGDKTDEPDSCPAFYCQPGQFQCNNSEADNAQCINPSFLCDADNDCDDGSDEVNCYSHTCLPSQWKCMNASKCISLSYRCDGRDHCPREDGGIAEDEDDCPSPTCSPNHFRCVATGRCIPNIWVCDRENDCVNGTDEIDCNNQSKTCEPDEFLCHSGNCLPNTWHCDGENDCADASDELDCKVTICPTSSFQCAGSNRCIPLRWKCDLDQDCSDGSDEKDCPMYTCSPEEKMCASGNRCIPNRWWCDDEDDCGDNSDEENCDSPKNATCNSNEFQCDNSHCIPSTWQCDSDLDCVDGSDENDCNIQPNRACSTAEITCDNNLCKPLAWICDGDDDCGDNSDEKEEHCAYARCTSSEFQCLNKKCVPSRQLCDGHDDCGDKSDEHCNENHCKSDQFKCDSMQCINSSLVCDHIKHCENASDEMHCMDGIVNPCELYGNEQCDVCKQTIEGYYCECRDGFKLQPDRSCSDIDECSDFGHCSQLCTNLEGSFLCQCSDGYYKEIRSGKSTCKAVGAREYLLLPESSQVIKYSPERNSYTSEYSGNVRIGAMDFHYDSSTVFMITLHQKNISKLTLSDGFRRRREVSQEILPITGLSDPQDIAVDWVSGKIYWTDAGNDVIQVSNLNGLNQMTLINTDLDQPQAIVLHPKKGLMFWSDWGSNPKIEVANMDGSGRADLVTKDLHWPTGLALDYTQDRLYWADPKAKVIGSIRLNGTDKRVVVNSTALMIRTDSVNTLLEPFALDIFEDWIYCLTYKKNEMFRVNKFGLDSVEMLKDNIRQISDLVIVQEQKQQAMPDPCHAFQCDGGICLLRAESKAVCKCFAGSKESTCIAGPCTDYHCLHGGTCQVDSNRQPVCSCLDGYYGNTCEQSKTDPCLNYCKNGGNCSATEGVAKCSCPVQFVGAQCGKDLCSGYCKNEGICSVKAEDPTPTCSCPADFSDPTCSTSSKTSPSQRSSKHTGSLEIAIPTIIIILVIIIIGAVFCYRRQRLMSGFKHSRLGSTDADRNFGNPMYIYKPHNEDSLLESPFEMDMDKTSNFSNPAYGSLYNDRNSGSQLSLDEKKHLIDDIEDDNQPLIVDDFDISFSG